MLYPFGQLVILPDPVIGSGLEGLLGELSDLVDLLGSELVDDVREAPFGERSYPVLAPGSDPMPLSGRDPMPVSGSDSISGSSALMVTSG